MKEKDRNQLNNNNIQSLNQTSISSNCKSSFKSRSIPPLLRIKPNAAGSDQGRILAEEALFDSDIEIVDDYEARKQKNADGESSPVRKIRGSAAKKETPLLQIFDGNVVISQELSIEEVQNLLSQINSKLQSQNSVNSADFPNITFSKEENSDIEIILDDANGLETDRGDRIVLNKFPKVLAKSEDWTDQPGNKGKVLLKSLSVGNKVAEILDQPSTSSETNLLISFKAFGDGGREKSNAEHDYTGGKLEETKEDEPMVEQVVVDNPETELMQIELIEPVNASAAGTGTAIAANCSAEKGESRSSVSAGESQSFF
ncbi:UNVERIFIED_CONTAM: hypothetical protein PYX00_010262 [Menopon gallinae]|uniref:Uncharacterized protein n=1 Tax=Menopon gallinae TaxID=328185 RepID=A0AAW2HEM7_9NEOP